MQKEAPRGLFFVSFPANAKKAPAGQRVPRLSKTWFFDSLSIETTLSIEFATPIRALRAQFGVVCIKTEIYGPGHLLLAFGQFTLCSRFL